MRLLPTYVTESDTTVLNEQEIKRLRWMDEKYSDCFGGPLDIHPPTTVISIIICDYCIIYT